MARKPAPRNDYLATNRAKSCAADKLGKRPAISRGLWRRACANRRSMNGAWPGRIFSRASSGANHAARSTSGKDCMRPLFGGHSISNSFDLRLAGSKSPVDGEGGDQLSAGLRQLTEIETLGRPVYRARAELLGEFADGDGERVFAVLVFALGDRPGAEVLLGPERTARDARATARAPAGSRDTATGRRFVSWPSPAHQPTRQTAHSASSVKFPAPPASCPPAHRQRAACSDSARRCRAACTGPSSPQGPRHRSATRRRTFLRR